MNGRNSLPPALRLTGDQAGEYAPAADPPDGPQPKAVLADKGYDADAPAAQA